jgi:YrbI family 3-deoxy-D-manno-octulosonate 8-phosphate phosphatase
MSVIAVIPARGGSKGVPGKNLKRVGGLSLVGRAVVSALASQLIDRVIVSTDDPAIAAAAQAAGAETMERSPELSGDTATSESVLLDVLERCDEMPDALVFIQATSPFIDPNDLDGAIARVLDGDEDVVFSAVETYAFLWKRGDAGATGVNHDHSFRPRRQDREPHFQETGAFYVMDAAGFSTAGFRFFGTVGIAEVDPRTAIEIDNVDELEIANAIAPTLPSFLTSSGMSGYAIDVDAVVTDFDGVHTDDRVIVASDGTEMVSAHRGDGMGVRMLRERGIPFLILSTETNPVVSARAAKLTVEVLQGITNKTTALAEWAAERGIPLTRIAYVGNDVNDLGPLGIVGWPIAVATSVPEVLAAARIILRSDGGNGAVREVADRVLASKSDPSIDCTAPHERTELTERTAPHEQEEHPWLIPSVHAT